jgi:GT2 family glycosyltransferase
MGSALDRTRHPAVASHHRPTGACEGAPAGGGGRADRAWDAGSVATTLQPRIELLHLQTAQLSDPPRCSPGGEFLAIIWTGDQPVGQVYGRADDAGRIDPQALRNATEDALIQDDRDSDSAEAPAPRTASVVICTRDRAETLARTLRSLREQTRRPDQIVVVDNASRGQRTRSVALAAGADYVREDRPGLDIARNTGARKATAEIVAYTDDDVTLHPRWLERLIAAFDSEGVMAVTGLVLPAELETSSQILFERHWGFGRGFRRIDFDARYFARHLQYGCPVWKIGAGASMAFRRRAFAEVGYFDERLDVGAAGCCGDSEYWYRILAAGFTCRYEPSAVAFHFHRRDHDALARQIFAYMRAHVVALLIQFERHGHFGNLRRLLVSLPYWYGRRVARRILRGTDDTNRLLFVEIRGALAGLIYYLRARRTPPGIWP